ALIPLPSANYKYPTPAPQVPGPPEPTQTTSSYQTTLYYSSPTSQTNYILTDGGGIAPKLIIEPWMSTNNLGGKSFLGHLLPDQKVVAKLWDGYKHDSTERDQELSVYMKLQSLWETYIPRLICAGDFDFFWGLILEVVEVCPQSQRPGLLR